MAQLVKNPPSMRETWVRSLEWEDPLEKGTATYSSILAWRSPWGRKELDMTEWLSTAQHTHPLLTEGCFGGVESLTPLADHFVPSGNL